MICGEPNCSESCRRSAVPEGDTTAADDVRSIILRSASDRKGGTAMSNDSYPKIKELLTGDKPEEVMEGLALVEKEVDRIAMGEAGELLDIITTIYHLDVLDNPAMVPVLEKVVDLTVRMGSWTIPLLIEQLDTGDMKSQSVIAHILGKFGQDAIDPLIAEYSSTTNPTFKSIILYALGKIRSPSILKAVNPALDASQSSSLELRDTATRALGKFLESIPSGQLTLNQKDRYIECLHANLADQNNSIRSKALRSLGKMARFGHMTDNECEKLAEICRHMLGIDGTDDWDRAFIVRKEAEIALRFLNC
jgi:hypothetical protein